MHGRERVWLGACMAGGRAWQGGMRGTPYVPHASPPTCRQCAGDSCVILDHSKRKRFSLEYRCNEFAFAFPIALCGYTFTFGILRFLFVAQLFCKTGVLLQWKELFDETC